MFIISDKHTHPFPGGEWEYFQQLIDSFLLLKKQLNAAFGPSVETVTDRISKGDQANLVWTGSLILVSIRIPDYFMAKCGCQPELIKLGFFPISLKVILDLFPLQNTYSKRYLAKNHLICCEGASLISEYTVNNSKFFEDWGIEHSCISLGEGIVEFAIEREKDAEEGFDAVDDHVESDGDQEVEHEENGEEDQCRWVLSEVHSLERFKEGPGT